MKRTIRRELVSFNRSSLTFLNLWTLNSLRKMIANLSFQIMVTQFIRKTSSSTLMKELSATTIRRDTLEELYQIRLQMSRDQLPPPSLQYSARITSLMIFQKEVELLISSRLMTTKIPLECIISSSLQFLFHLFRSL